MSIMLAPQEVRRRPVSPLTRVGVEGGASRVLRLVSGAIEVHVSVEAAVRETAIEAAKGSFAPGQVSSEFELQTSFMAHLLQNFCTDDLDDDEAFLLMLRSFTLSLKRRHLHTRNILSLTRPGGAGMGSVVASHAARMAAVKTWFDATRLLLRAGLVSQEETRMPGSALCADALSSPRGGGVCLMGLLGGQGLDDGGSYLSELRETLATYGALASDFVESVAGPLEEHAQSQKDGASAHFYGKWGLDVVQWLRSPSSQPDETYLQSSPVSFPLIGLVQITHYAVMLAVARLEPAAGRQLFARAGIAGHSQGVVAAVVVACSSTWDELRANTRAALLLLCWIGLRSQQAFPAYRLSPNVVAASIEQGEGVPTPMLAVTGLPFATVESFVKECNSHLPQERLLHCSLINGPRSIVVTGHPLSLFGLQVRLRKIRQSGGDEQHRIPFSKRLVKFDTRYLRVTCAFHNPLHLSSVPALVNEDMRRGNVQFPSADKLAVPVFSTHSGADLREEAKTAGNSISLSFLMAELCCVKEVFWEKATASLYRETVTHAIDFGPGGRGGIGRLVAHNTEGRGVQVVMASCLFDAPTGTSGQHSRALLDNSWLHAASETTAASRGDNWIKQHAPQCVKTLRGTLLNTRFTRLLGKPHIMVAGMTPTSSNAIFCAAVLNAGYHVELGCGGLHSEAAFRAAVAKITSSLVIPGDGFAVNMLYLNQRAWNWQFPLALALRQQGYPINGLTIGAGVPSAERASEIIGQMLKAGMRHLSLKPSSSATILEVKAIAEKNPDISIILQWTGGRGGGHHSYEDCHEPILRTYGALRSVPNLVLVMGSGLGDAAGSWPYMNGSWSLQHQRAAMPFDGIMLGSRMLVSEEALTSPEAKQLIIDCAGCSPAEWEKSYDGVVGGVTTVRSEMNEPIHMVANRGVLFWKEMDTTCFSLPKDKMAAFLLSNRDKIVARLNADYQRPWFAPPHASLHDMTYTGVARRCVDLMHVSHRWVDGTWETLVAKWLTRIEERFGVDKNGSVLAHSRQLLQSDPFDVLSKFEARYTDATEQLISAEDMLFFLSLCRASGTKPVPFIPVLDENFETYFKKDSLWQSEDLSAVPNRDAGRVCILQGPVAAKYSVKVEPTKIILDEIHRGHIRASESSEPREELDFVGGPIPKHPTEEGGRSSVTFAYRDGETPVAWRKRVAGGTPWLETLLTIPHIVRGKFYIANPLVSLLDPRGGMTVRQNLDEKGFVEAVDVDGTLSISKRGSAINLTLVHQGGLSPVALTLVYAYQPELAPFAPISEVSGREAAILAFYKQLWSGGPDNKGSFLVTREGITKFSRSTDQVVEPGARLIAPLDYAVVIAWPELMQALTSVLEGTDLLKLVHLDNQFHSLNGPISEGDVVRTTAKVVQVTNEASGKRVQVSASLHVQDHQVCRIVSSFFIRGTYDDNDSTFVLREEAPRRVKLESQKDVELLLSKKWFQPEPNCPLLRAGAMLTFSLSTEVRGVQKQGPFADFRRVFGVVTSVTSANELQTVGHVKYECSESSKGDPVWGYLKRFGAPIAQDSFFESGGHSMGDEDALTFVTPSSQFAYASSSGDFNPIHTNRFFCALADLEGGVIVHGMWTSAATRKLVEVFAADNVPQRVTIWKCEFFEVVRPAQVLKAQLAHIGMSAGRLLVQATVFNSEGRAVLKGLAHVEQARTAYVFTGQGSQHVGMGMELMATSKVARDIWERADNHFVSIYGFSILHIVRNNPVSCTVHFGGPQGALIRERYMSMSYPGGGALQNLPLFPDIAVASESYTFRNPAGLLFATQFAQPALTLMELAAHEDMNQRGIVQRDAPFCGHSLGEYAALAAVGEVLPVETLVDVVFYRGLTMSRAVPRKADGSSDYGMVAVNPARVSRFFSQAMLEVLIKCVAASENGLLEVVNYNVENWQYVAAGTLRCLDVLQKTLDRIVKDQIDLRVFLSGGRSVPADLAERGEQIERTIAKFVSDCAATAQKTNIVLVQGHATIPIPGIDVPFHSTLLRGGVSAFRDYLGQRVRPSLVNVERLSGKYIPNVVAEPFSLEKRYLARVATVTGSEILAHIVSSWNDAAVRSAEETQLLGHVLLIELLAYQFASSVRWIETMDVLFKTLGVERLIEIGPTPTLVNMAARTLKLKYEVYDESVTFRRSLLSWEKNRDEIYFHSTNTASAAVAAPAAKAEVSVSAKPLVVAAAAPQVAAAPPSSSSSGGAIQSIDIISAIVASKLKAQADPSKTIRALSGGRSALQNEILGELAKEFPSLEAAEGIEEKPLLEIAAKVGAVQGLGKVSSQLVSRAMMGVMPAGFDARSFLERAYGADAVNKVLLHAAPKAPSTRFASEAVVQEWLAQIAASVGVKPKGQAVQQQQQNQVVRMDVGDAAAPALVADAKTSPEFFLRVLLAKKVGVTLDKISSSASIRTATNGKSAMQNEIQGDLIKEFGEKNVPEEAGTMELSALAAALAPRYSGFGEWSSAAVNQLLRNKLPFSVSSCRQFLEQKGGLQKGRQDAVLMLLLVNEPPARISAVEAGEQLLLNVLQQYSKLERVDLPALSGQSGSSSASMASGAAMSAEALSFILRSESIWREQLETVARYLKIDLRGGQKRLATEQSIKEGLERQLSLWRAEHGIVYEEAIAPVFDAKKARHFDSWWNWVRQDALSLCYDIIYGRLTAIDRDVVATCVPVINRSDDALVNHTNFVMERCKKTPNSAKHALVWELGQPLLGACRNGAAEPPVFWDMHYPKAPKTIVDTDGTVRYVEIDRPGVRNLNQFVSEMRSSLRASDVFDLQKELLEMIRKARPENVQRAEELLAEVGKLNAAGSGFLTLKRRTSNGTSWCFSHADSIMYLDAMQDLATGRVTFQNKDVLVTGAGSGSIGIELVLSLLTGGARVCVTTSRYTSAAMKKFCDCYQKRGSRGSQLVVVPFNAASSADCQSLVKFIFTELKWDLDFILPFAAIDESGADLSSLDGRSEVAHRMMLTNVERLLGHVVSHKQAIGSATRPAQVVLPLSPNHGVFGNDGLYSESKVGLEMLLSKWFSEEWSSYLSLAGAVIGWTRGTALMEAQNVLAAQIEQLGVRTFSTKEMAFCLLSLLHPNICRKAQESPIMADFGGRLLEVDDLSKRMQSIRKSLDEESALKRLICKDSREDSELFTATPTAEPVEQRANLKFEYYDLPNWRDLSDIRAQLQGLIDLESVIVVTGFGEVGPWGSARTRWEMEAQGVLSLEGCIELAWTMGLIEQSPTGLGWIDRATKKPLKDLQVKELYEDTIMQHCGIRFIEPELVDGYDPNKKEMMQAVSMEQDMPPFHVTEEEAQQFTLEHQHLVEVFKDDSGKLMARLLKGAVVYVPKALRFERLVAGLVPQGWDARRFGIPEDIINQVDPISLYNLVSTQEALISAGITDPYELFQYIHVSELGNATGSGQGGMRAQSRIYKSRHLDRGGVQSDILQENFINTAAAWVNMLLLSSAGPIKTPVGACATAVESLEIGVDTILSGKAQVMVVGAVDDFGEEGSFEFAQMRATSDAINELAHGRDPREMSRPATSTRSGFMESHGAGTQIIMSAALAVRLGVPIYAVIAHTSTATDREGRSVPAPGQGILTSAREPKGVSTVSLEYRRRQLQYDLEFLEQWVHRELAAGEDVATVQMEAARRRKNALRAVGQAGNASSPLRTALAVFGLTIDDVQVCSFHGTGTKANDLNESRVLYEQLRHLGRTVGNAVPAVMQKHLTGHPKGPAAAWMLNGLIQTMLTAIIPGNRNADNIDSELREFSSLIYFPSISVQHDEIRAGLLHSFGFGQVGGEVLIVHPKYVLALLDEAQYEAYRGRRDQRQKAAYRHHHAALAGTAPFVKVKNAPPFKAEQQQMVFLDPSWRLGQKGAVEAASLMGAPVGSGGIGVDLEPIASINLSNTTFLERNFTAQELATCRDRPDPQASLAARWCAKEAVTKALLSLGKLSGSPGAQLRDIEIVSDESGAPGVVCHGKAGELCRQLHVTGFKITMTHSGEYAMAFATANK